MLTWLSLLFLALFVASLPACTVASRTLQGLGLDKPWLAPLPVVFLVLVTWACLRLRREPLAAVGLHLDRAWARDVLGGAPGGAARLGLAREDLEASYSRLIVCDISGDGSSGSWSHEKACRKPRRPD